MLIRRIFLVYKGITPPFNKHIKEATMNSISANNGNYRPTAQSQMNGSLQENQLALTKDEASVLQQMIQQGLLPASTAAALMGASKRSELGVTSLGLAGALQQGWQDQSILDKVLGERIKAYDNRVHRNHYNQRYIGEGGVKLWEKTANKHGMALFGADGTPLSSNVNNLVQNGPALEMHTVNANGEVLKYQARNNGFWQKFGNVRPRVLGIDTGGPFDDTLRMEGHSNAVVSSGKQYTNALEKLEKIKNGGATPEAIKIAEAVANKNLLEFDQIRLQEASKSLINHETVLKLEKETLDKLKKGTDTAKITAQEARVAQIQKVADAQRQHVIKLNNENAKFVATQTAQNVDDLAKGLMKNPNILQKAANLFNGDRTKSMQLYNQLQSHGFDKAQLKTIQDAIATGSEDAVKEALKTAAEQSKTTAESIANAAKNGVSSLDDGAKAALDATLESKGAMGALRNNLGIMGKVTKGLAIVGTALEALNFGVNMQKGDHRKGFSDLTTNVGSGLLAAGLIGLTGLTFWPALAAGAVVGWGISTIAAPWVDKGFKALGFTNKNERDAEKAKGELQQVNQRLASVPTGMAPA
jgi:hypothetical protein